MLIIGITGTSGAGKGTIATYLVKQYGFKHLSVRDFIVKEIKRRGMEVNRDRMIEVANDLRSNHGAEYIVMELYKEALKSNKNCIIESIRSVGEVEALQKQKDFVLWGVDASIEQRYRRAVKRNGSTDIVTFEEFKEQEKRETTSEDKSKQNITKCLKMADVVFNNNGSIKDLQKQIDMEIKSLL